MTPAPETPRLLDVRYISHPPGLYGYATWLDDTTLAVQYKAELTDVLGGKIWRLGIVDGSFKQITLPKHPSCGPDGQNGYDAPHSLPDGRMGYFVRCRVPGDDLLNIRLHLMAYDTDSGTVEQLLNYEFPDFSIGTGAFAWNPAMTRGLMGDGRFYIDEQLYWYAKDGSEPLDVGLVQAYGPTWSPDGEQIAFIGSKEKGSPLAYSNLGLYIMNSDGKEVHPILEGFRASSGVAWSPLGRWLVFPGAFGERESEMFGLWLYDLERNRLLQIAEGVFDVPSWSTDGERLAVVQFLGPPLEREHRVAIVEVGPLLGG